MTFAEYTLENAPINARPQCPECKTQKTQMYLARITPDEPGFDLRTFECPRCRHVETVVVEYKKTASVSPLSLAAFRIVAGHDRQGTFNAANEKVEVKK
jgi:hypothetical protein